MTSLLLLGLAVALAAAVPGRLAHAAWVYRSPRLGVLGWQAIALAMLMSVVMAVLSVVLPSHPAHDAACGLWRVCLDALAGAHGGLAQAAAWAGLLVLTAGLARVVLATNEAVRAYRRSQDHAALVRLIGHERPDLQATVVERPEPAVYLVPGRCAQVVLTTGAMARLGGDELAAVLAHEHAHADARHHRPLALAALLHAAFPAVGLFRQAHRQIGRLVEMVADDRACREHSRLALARALAALAVPAVIPGVLAGTGGDAVERMHRLMSPPPPLPLRVRAVVALGLLALPLVPVVLAMTVPVYG